MANIAMGPAIASGLQLITQRPLAVLAWGFAYVLIAVIPQFLMIGALLPDLMNFSREVVTSATAGQSPRSNPELLAMQAQLARFQPLQLLVSLVGSSIVNSAIYRAVLEPENKAFAYLRLGAQELWVGLVTIVFYVLVVIALFAALIPFGIATAVTSGAAGASWATGLIVFLLACATAAAVIWVALRLSLGVPMSFAQKSFRLFESWDLTRQQGWRLLGVILGVVAIILIGELFIFGVAGALGAATVMTKIEGLKAFIAHPPANWLALAAPWITFGVAFYTVFAGVTLTILAAPFATILRQLSPPNVGDSF
jgi:hypothetical protein